MPGFATHYLFGVTTMQKQKHTPLYAPVHQHPTVYGIGLQGPDIFFYYLPDVLPAEMNPGTAAHRERTGRFLYYLIQSRRLFDKPDEREIAYAYILGFLGHYTLDTTCHPYIFGRTHYDPKDISYYGRHVYLETDIDAFLLAHYKKMLPSEFRQSDSIRLTSKECRIVAGILYYTYRNVFPELKLSYFHIYTAIRFLRIALFGLRDPSGKKKSLVRLVERQTVGYAYISPLIPSDRLRFTLDSMNFSHKRWRNPWKKTDTSRESFFDLMQRARTRYQKRISLCEQLFQYDEAGSAEQKSPSDASSCRALVKQLIQEIGNKSYSSGLELEEGLL